MRKCERCGRTFKRDTKRQKNCRECTSELRATFTLKRYAKTRKGGKPLYVNCINCSPNTLKR